MGDMEEQAFQEGTMDSKRRDQVSMRIAGNKRLNILGRPRHVTPTFKLVRFKQPRLQNSIGSEYPVRDEYLPTFRNGQGIANYPCCDKRIFRARQLFNMMSAHEADHALTRVEITFLGKRAPCRLRITYTSRS